MPSDRTTYLFASKSINALLEPYCSAKRAAATRSKENPGNPLGRQDREGFRLPIIAKLGRDLAAGVVVVSGS